MARLFNVLCATLLSLTCCRFDPRTDSLPELALLSLPLLPISLTATRVYGQGGSLTSGNANNPSLNADSLNAPFKPAIASDGVYLADQQNARVLFYSGATTTAVRVYGTGGSFSISGNLGTTGSTFSSIVSANVPEVFSDTSGIYVSDIWASRMLFFPGTATTATRVYGQFGTLTWDAQNNNGANGAGTPTADTLAQAQGIATDATGVYIADTFNHRVLFYPGTSTTAARVYGQPGFTTGSANQGGRSANSLNEPRGICVDETGLYVAEVQNHRVLFYPGTSTTATRVYGQNGDFTTATPGASATSLNGPWFVRSFRGKVYIADSGNNRVLEFEGTSTTATRVWGQAGSFTSSAVNLGGISATSLNQPFGIDVDATGMYVADSSNHRMLFYSR